MKSKIIIEIVLEEITKVNSFWKYEASMVVFGKKRFLTYADSVGDAKKTAFRRLRALLLKSDLPD